MNLRPTDYESAALTAELRAQTTQKTCDRSFPTVAKNELYTGSSPFCRTRRQRSSRPGNSVLLREEPTRSVSLLYPPTSRNRSPPLRSTRPLGGRKDSGGHLQKGYLWLAWPIETGGLSLGLRQNFALHERFGSTISQVPVGDPSGDRDISARPGRSLRERAAL